MFGIGMTEMLIILAVALIFIGPKKLPELAKSLGRAMGEFKRATSDLKQSIESETGMDDVRQSFGDVKEEMKTQVDLAGEVPDPSPPPSENPTDRASAAALDPAEAGSAKEASDDTTAAANDPQDDASPDHDSDSRDTQTP
jgi:sec-independent protein translocase protein TatB